MARRRWLLPNVTPPCSGTSSSRTAIRMRCNCACGDCAPSSRHWPFNGSCTPDLRPRSFA
jgi:hypothetical protein